MDDVHDTEKNSYATPTSSPSSTPSSPLPISVGAGNEKYFFSSSPSPSPPFSPPTSPPDDSAECLPLLHETKKVLISPITAVVPSTFSLDRNRPDDLDSNQSSCLKDWLEWFLQKCCSCIVGNDFLQRRGATRLPLIRD